MRWTCPSDKLPEARRLLEAAFRPAPEEEIAKALYTMRVMVRGRDGEMKAEDAGAVEIAAWVLRLQEFPADVAISVVQDWPKQSQWWPTWFELNERLQQAMSQRRVMLHTLAQLEAQVPQERLRLNDKPEEPKTDEERAAFVDGLLKGLARDARMGPFHSLQKRADTVRGRTTPIDEERERAEAEKELADILSAPGTYRLSEAALKSVGIGLEKKSPKARKK